MSEHIYLMGSEDVRSAGQTMRCAAEEMTRAASSIDSTMQQFSRRLSDFEYFLTDIVERIEKVGVR